MPKEPNENRVKARQMFKDGMALVEIAEKLGISEGTVRSWKSRDKWDGKKKRVSKKKNAALQKSNATPHPKSVATPKKNKTGRKRGGQPHNKNAVGGAGNPDPIPPPLKHGGYSNVYWNVLTDEEKDLIMDIHSEPEMILMDQVKMLTVREHRIMKAINKYRQMEFENGGLYITDTVQIQHKRLFKDDAEKALYEERKREKVEKREQMPGEGYTLQTRTGATIDLLTRLEREMTYVQGQKTKAVEALTKYRMEKQRIENASAGSVIVDDWIKAILEDEEEADDES